MSQKSLALFDLDYTLYKGDKTQYHVILDFPYFLNANGLFPKKVLDKMKNEFEGYQQKKIDRKTFADNEIRFYYEGMQSQLVKDIEEAAKQWLFKSTGLLYEYAYELVRLMKGAAIPTIIISGSPIEPLKFIKQDLGVDELYATKGKIDEQGAFTGTCEVEFANAEAKRKLIQTFDFDPSMSFAFGDSESDYPLLEAVYPKNSFLFRDDVEDATSSSARAKGWQVHSRNIGVVNLVKKRLEEAI